MLLICMSDIRRGWSRLAIVRMTGRYSSAICNSYLSEMDVLLSNAFESYEASTKWQYTM
jgi:hypothetical protein